MKKGSRKRIQTVYSLFPDLLGILQSLVLVKNIRPVASTVPGHKSWTAASVGSKTTLIKVGVRGATCKLGTFFQIPLTLTMPISNNFQLNGASGETLKLLDHLFSFKL